MRIFNRPCTRISGADVIKAVEKIGGEIVTIEHNGTELYYVFTDFTYPTNGSMPVVDNINKTDEAVVPATIATPVATPVTEGRKSKPAVHVFEFTNLDDINNIDPKSNRGIGARQLEKDFKAGDILTRSKHVMPSLLKVLDKKQTYDVITGLKEREILLPHVDPKIAEGFNVILVDKVDEVDEVAAKRTEKAAATKGNDKGFLGEWKYTGKLYVGSKPNSMIAQTLLAFSQKLVIGATYTDAEITSLTRVLWPTNSVANSQKTEIMHREHRAFEYVGDDEELREKYGSDTTYNGTDNTITIAGVDESDNTEETTVSM